MSTFLVSNFTKIKIGDKCLFSDDVVFCSNDSHSIFDVDTKKNINSTEEICKKREIDIGDHVWIGIRSTILYNTKIGNGSIVALISVLSPINTPEYFPIEILIKSKISELYPILKAAYLSMSIYSLQLIIF